jgi:hypothetical protein
MIQQQGEFQIGVIVEQRCGPRESEINEPEGTCVDALSVHHDIAGVKISVDQTAESHARGVPACFAGTEPEGICHQPACHDRHRLIAELLDYKLVQCGSLRRVKAIAKPGFQGRLRRDFEFNLVSCVKLRQQFAGDLAAIVLDGPSLHGVCGNDRRQAVPSNLVKDAHVFGIFSVLNQPRYVLGSE